MSGQPPWEQAFTSRGAVLGAIVVAGLTFAFGEGGSKRVLAGVLFGVGMATAAAEAYGGNHESTECGHYH